jgi:hypothetical protein
MVECGINAKSLQIIMGNKKAENTLQLKDKSPVTHIPQGFLFGA